MCQKFEFSVMKCSTGDVKMRMVKLFLVTEAGLMNE